MLDTGASKLTDADLNEEAANSQALTTRQSLGISALSLANTRSAGRAPAAPVISAEMDPEQGRGTAPAFAMRGVR